MNRTFKTTLLFSCAAGAILLVASYIWWDEHRPVPPQPPPPQAMHMLQRPVLFMKLGIQQPPTLPAAQAQLADRSEIIGVEVAGKYRAYAVSAFPVPTAQVVNDLVGNVPVTVTYCIDGKRVRVFTSDQRGAPLQMALAPDVEGGNILLGIGKFFYSQKSLQSRQEGAPRFPYPELPVVRTSWKAWKQLHPDTDVYVGLPNNGQTNPPPP